MIWWKKYLSIKFLLLVLQFFENVKVKQSPIVEQVSSEYHSFKGEEDEGTDSGVLPALLHDPANHLHGVSLILYPENKVHQLTLKDISLQIILKQFYS